MCEERKWGREREKRAKCWAVRRAARAEGPVEGGLVEGGPAEGGPAAAGNLGTSTSGRCGGVCQRLIGRQLEANLTW